jgi:PAS domain S-box-containing protein
MAEHDSYSSFRDGLRRRATERVGSDWPEPIEPFAPEEVHRILRDLRVHQVELEMQNEELQRRQLDIEASRKRYVDLFDLAPVGYLTLTEQGRIVEANLTLAALLGVPRGDLVAAHLSASVAPEDHDAYFRNRRQIFQSRQPTVFEVRLLRNGLPFWASLEGVATHQPDGTRVCRLAVSDVTERKKLDAAKEAFEQQAQQLRKAESLGRMAAAVAHHFNNMLGGVLGNLELAMSGMSKESDTWELLFAAMGAGRRAAEVSGLMLTYLGQASGERDLLDLSKICRKTLVSVRSSLPASVTLRTEFPPYGPIVKANANHVKQALNNLVTNAWEASSETPSTIRVSVTTVSAGAIGDHHRFPADWTPSDPHSSYACVEVADQGAGIPSSSIPDLFDPFFSQKFVGRGLGLAVVLGIARAHDGLITVDSWPGEGSVFRLFLPASIDGPLRQTTPPASRPLPVEPATVLFVDDEELVRNMAAMMLRRLGFNVLEAKSGADAIELCRQRTSDIHCVVCDVTMPGMGGWETLEGLRKLMPNLPVVLASGFGEAQVMDGLHPQPPDGFLPKPFQMEELNESICRAMARLER